MKKIKAIIFDVYGTIIKQDLGDLADSLGSPKRLLISFEKLIKK